MDYLKIKANNQTKAYPIKMSAEKPYLKVSGGYVPLTTQTTTGIKLKAKVDGVTYIGQEDGGGQTKTRTYYTTAYDSAGMSDVTALTDTVSVTNTDTYTQVTRLLLRAAVTSGEVTFGISKGSYFNTYSTGTSHQYVLDKTYPDNTPISRDASSITLSGGVVPKLTKLYDLVSTSAFDESVSEDKYLVRATLLTTLPRIDAAIFSKFYTTPGAAAVSINVTTTSFSSRTLAYTNRTTSSYTSVTPSATNWKTTYRRASYGIYNQRIFTYQNDRKRTTVTIGNDANSFTTSYSDAVMYRSSVTDVAYSVTTDNCSSTYSATIESTTAYSGVSSETYEE